MPVPAWREAPSGQCHLALVKGHQNQPKIIAVEKVMSRSGDYEWAYFSQAIRGEADPDELSLEEMVEGIRVMQAITKIDSSAS